jgi:tetratricopeptide (TPR) repeat protein
MHGTTSLTSLGLSLGELGRYPEALAAHDEALGLWRDLATQQPARHTPDLATSLDSLGGSLRELGRYPEALAPLEEAVGLQRDLAAQQPARHTDNLATSLNSLGASLGVLERYPEALAPLKETVGLQRDLATQQPPPPTPPHPTPRYNWATTLCQLGRHDEELTLRTEATVRWGILARLDPDEHHDAYQRARDRLVDSYSKHGHKPGAAWEAEENSRTRLEAGMTPPKPQRRQEQHP